MSACGNWQWKVRWVSHNFAWWWKVSRCEQSCRHNWIPSLRWGNVEKPQWNMAFLLIAPDITAGYERVFGLVTVWAHPCKACYHTVGVAAHKVVLLVMKAQTGHMLCLVEWGLIPCASLGQGTCQHHDGWHAHHGCPWPAPPAANMQTIAAQGNGGMPRRFEWQVRSLTVYLPGAAPLGCHHPQQTCLQTTADRSEPQQHAAREHNNSHSDSHYYTGATPSPANTIEPPSDIAAAINLQLMGALEWLQQASATASAFVS